MRLDLMQRIEWGLCHRPSIVGNAHYRESLSRHPGSDKESVVFGDIAAAWKAREASWQAPARMKRKGHVQEFPAVQGGETQTPSAIEISRIAAFLGQKGPR